MTAVVDGFTSDVLTLITLRKEGADAVRDGLNQIESRGGDLEVRAQYLQTTLMGVLSEYMVKTPPFVQQVVARALMEHVDWKEVASRVSVNVEAN
jgi:hypothetical protein